MKATSRKTCRLCTRSLPLTDFYRKGDSYHAYCKLCHYDRTRELRAIAAERRALEGHQ